jgi:hypothetical protein
MNTLALAMLIVAVVLFAVETVRSRSLLAGGLCALALAFAIPGIAAAA